MVVGGEVLTRSADPYNWITDPVRILPCSSVAFNMVKKNKFSPRFFCIIIIVSTFTSVLKDNKSLRSNKTVEIKVFCLLMKESGSVQTITDPTWEAQQLTVPIQESQKLMAPDPEH